MKRFLTVLLASLLVFALVSCGPATPVTRGKVLTLGDYVIEFAGYELTNDSLGGDAVLITYNFTNNSDEYYAFCDATYYEAFQGEESLNGTTIYVSEESMDTITKNEYEEIEPGATIEVVLAYELLDTTTPVKVSFEGFGDGSADSHDIDLTAPFVAASSVPSSSSSSSSSDVEDNGDAVEVEAIGEFGDSEWYGWWMVTDATGEFEEYDGAYFDCCANFEPTSEGYTLMSIWDEVYTDYNNNCIGEIYLEHYEDLGYSSVEGFFLTGDDIASEGQVMVIPEAAGVENALYITIPVETADGGFTEEVFLREWGYEWDEELATTPTYYDSYFLPLMEDGEALPVNLDDIG